MRKIPKERVIEEMKRINDEVDGVPTCGDWREKASISYYVLHQRFDSIGELRQAAGVTDDAGILPENHPDASEQDYIEDIQTVGEIVDRPPSVGDLDEHGEYELGSIINHFETMPDAREAAGFAREYNHHGDRKSSKQKVQCKNCGKEELKYTARADEYIYCSNKCMGADKRKHSTDDILESLESLCSDLNRAASVVEFREHTGISHGVFEQRQDLDSYSTEIRKLGFQPLCPKDLSDKQLIKDLQALEIHLDRAPNVSDVMEQGLARTAWPYVSRWGGFLSALESAGITPTSDQRISISDDELISDFNRVADELGVTPSYNDIIEHGKFSPATYERSFGTFLKAKEACGYDATASYHNARDFTETEMIQYLHQLCFEVGGIPSATDVAEREKMSVSSFKLRFGSWRDGLKAAGFNPDPVKIPEDDLKEELRRMAEMKGRPPFQREMEQAKYSYSVYVQRWGSWLKAREAAGLDTVVRHPSLRVSEQSAIQDLQKIASEMGRCPSYSEYQERGQYSVGLFKQKFGSWNDGKEAAGFDRGYITVNYGTEGPTERPVYGRSWIPQRERARERDNLQCQRCGMTKEEHLSEYDTVPHVHHITPWHEFDDHEERNKLSNLITLCAACHKTYEKLPVKPQITGGRSRD